MPTVYTPPVSTYVPLASIELTSTDSEIIFSSIPATYRDLVLIANYTETTPTSGNIEMRFNSDTGSNYSQVFMAGRANNDTESSAGTFTHHFLNMTSRPSGFSTALLQIMDYSAIDKHTTTLGRINLGAADVAAYAYRYAVTTAINTISIKQSANSFAIGSSFSLYGIEA